MTDRTTKITFGDMRASGVRGIVVFCSDYTCSHSVAMSADQWADECQAVRYRVPVHLPSLRQARADVRPDFDWERRRVSV